MITVKLLVTVNGNSCTRVLGATFVCCCVILNRTDENRFTIKGKANLITRLKKSETYFEISEEYRSLGHIQRMESAIYNRMSVKYRRNISHDDCVTFLFIETSVKKSLLEPIRVVKGQTKTHVDRYVRPGTQTLYRLRRTDQTNRIVSWEWSGGGGNCYESVIIWDRVGTFVHENVSIPRNRWQNIANDRSHNFYER